MSIYRQLIYNTDTYGERIRTDIGISLVNTGSWEDRTGQMFARFKLRIGPMPSDLIPGSEIVVLRGSSWWPDIPDKGAYDKVSGFPRTDPVLIYRGIVEATTSFSDDFSDDFAQGDISNVGVIPDLDRLLTEVDMAPVPINSVLYVRIFVREPPIVTPDGIVALPWTVRGSAWEVMAGKYGGIKSAIDALPVTYYTDGDPYGVVVENTTVKFVSAIGFLADQIFTDGALMIDTPARLHPNMVEPLLKAYGMTREERAAFNDPVLAARLKNMLYAYRRMQMSRGTEGALAELARVLTGYAAAVLPLPENIVASLGDSTPAGGIEFNLKYQAMGAGFEVVGAHHSSVPTLVAEEWLDLWNSWALTNYWVDTWEEEIGNDLWLDRWDQVDLPDIDADAKYLVLPGPPIIQDDEWQSESTYPQYVDWVHALTFDEFQAQDGYIGTRSDLIHRIPLTSCSEPIPGGGLYRLRLRAVSQHAPRVTLHVIFLGEDGSVVSDDYTVPNDIGETWTELEHLVRAPDDARYVAWRLTVNAFTRETMNDAVITVDSTDSAVDGDFSEVVMMDDLLVTMNDDATPLDGSPPIVFFGAIELRQVGSPGTELTTTDPDTQVVTPFEIPSWCIPYRNPRSVVLAMHTPWIIIDPNSGLTMDSADVEMDTSSVKMNQGLSSPEQAIELSDRLAVDKVRELMNDHLPHTVSARIIAGWDEEYQLRYPQTSAAINSEIASVSYLPVV